MCSAPVSAQSDRPILRTPWVLNPPFWVHAPDGERTGFFAELARRIADQIGYDIVIQSYESLEEMIAAQNAGETDLVAVGTGLDLFARDNLSSDPVARTRIRLFVRSDNRLGIDPENARGLTVGTLGVAFSPEINGFLARQNVVNPTSSGQAVIGLLSGEYDAILYPEEEIVDLTRRSGIDHLIVPVGAPLAEQDRAVILHRSRAGLLDPINVAIATLEESGALEELRCKYRLELHAPHQTC